MINRNAGRTESEMKTRIFEAAIEIFNEKSLKFTMDDLARKLEMSKKTIYAVIPDKETLFLEAADYCFNAIKESERQIVEDSSLDVVQKLQKILIAMPDQYRTLDFRQVAVLQEKYPRIYQKVESRIDSQWEDTIALLEEGIQQEKIRPIRIPIFKTMMEATIMSFLSKDVLLTNEISYEEALEQMLDIMVRGILKNPQAATGKEV